MEYLLHPIKQAGNTYERQNSFFRNGLKPGGKVLRQCGSSLVDIVILLVTQILIILGNGTRNVDG